MTATLVLLRHGQSVFNEQNIFTGFLDCGLSKKGEDEARRAGLRLQNFTFDAVFTSVLKRASDTAKIALGDRLPREFFADAALNERHYGELQGMNKDDARAKFGAEQVRIWRRGYFDAPPGGESLAATCERVWAYFQARIAPRLKLGQTILVAAHGNSLRALTMHLEGLSATEIVSLEIPTGVPVVYQFDRELKLAKKDILAI